MAPDLPVSRSRPESAADKNAIPLRPEHVDQARMLLEETRLAGGLAPLDLGRFWQDDQAAQRDPFASGAPQLPFGARVTWECVFDELGVEEDHRRYQEEVGYRLSLNKAYNDKAERIIGVRPLDDSASDPARQWPSVKGLADVFEAKSIWHSNSWWLEASAHNEHELEALLDRVDRRDVRELILPPNWETEKRRLGDLGVPPPRYRHQRGPVTFAMSVYGIENLIYLIDDNPELARRFRDTILRVMLEIAETLDAEAGDTSATAPHGFYFCDDNCALLNPGMYELFGYPILKGVFERLSPQPNDLRGQHSDSAMEHLLPILGRLDLTSVNFGPTLSVAAIRRHCPKAVIHGQLAPFTYSRNQEERMLLELFRDHELALEHRGLVFATAGSVNNGTKLTSQRLLMAGVQRYCQY
jgi:uroporphyrinogen decarboxylase